MNKSRLGCYWCFLMSGASASASHLENDTAIKHGDTAIKHGANGQCLMHCWDAQARAQLHPKHAAKPARCLGGVPPEGLSTAQCWATRWPCCGLFAAGPGCPLRSADLPASENRSAPSAPLPHAPASGPASATFNLCPANATAVHLRAF